jgi:hypothetical protein
MKYCQDSFHSTFGGVKASSFLTNSGISSDALCIADTAFLKLPLFNALWTSALILSNCLYNLSTCLNHSCSLISLTPSTFLKFPIFITISLPSPSPEISQRDTYHPAGFVGAISPKARSSLAIFIKALSILSSVKRSQTFSSMFVGNLTLSSNR